MDLLLHLLRSLCRGRNLRGSGIGKARSRDGNRNKARTTGGSRRALLREKIEHQQDQKRVGHLRTTSKTTISPSTRIVFDTPGRI